MWRKECLDIWTKLNVWGQLYTIYYIQSYIDSSKLTKKGAFRRVLPQKQDRWQQGILSLKSANIVYIHSTKRHHQVYKVFWKMAGNYRKYGKNSNYFLKRSKVSNHPDLLLRLPRVYIVKYYCSWRYVWAYGNIAPVNTVRHLVVSLVINACLFNWRVQPLIKVRYA